MGDHSSVIKEANVAKGQLCKFIRLIEKENDDGERTITEKGPINEQPTQDIYSSYALVEKRFVKDKQTTRSLQVNSQHICDILKELTDSYPQRPSVWEPPLHFDAPFQLLFHHQEDLTKRHEAIKDDPAQEKQQEHLYLLLEYMNGEPAALAADMIRQNKITYSFLWYVFRPGIYVSYRDGNDERILWVEGITPSMMDFSGQFVTLHCLYREYNGWNEGASRIAIKLYENQYFASRGPVPIDLLPVCPLSCIDKRAIVLKDRMRKRGDIYDGLTRETTASRYYKGPFFAVSDDQEGWKLQTIAGRVIIDPQAFVEENPSRQIAVAPWPGNGPTERDILCPSHVHGYNLGTRQWGRFFIEQLSEFEYDQDLWSRVAMNEEQKRLLQSRVANHCPSPDLYDEDKLKGKGFVVLLHGVPGTGKTLTAVAIAEDIQKPLLLYPGGELGHDIDVIEERIKTVVRLASRWGAILLIDEADIFLESRRSSGEVSLERNALIAVFLRQLEHSTGVIFLTSNRASNFDSAVKSRVHITFRYPFPSLSTRRRIWEDLIKARNVESVDLLKSLDAIAEHAMDGREISNTLNSAIDLANHEEEIFDKRHLDVAVKTWALSCVHGFLKDKKLVLVVNS
ncbi:hypothetical protein CEP54_005464 [Fusarium duplospermum]|uniref:AAA+ ATPase domain-containing protein n=1 Tax=Fusarium duplospermum TaxID=1325734 RepID=A0A428QC83_9HYPO|nr:hypothetical protein CEP54_005464 [Fusarium duplospermum]